MSDQKPISVLMWSKKKRIFKATQPSAPKISPALFDDGTVGLRIVAAMSGVESGRPVNEKAKSDPIPIQAKGVGPILKLKLEEEEDGDDVELSESYTCVISRERGGTVRKRVYLGDGFMVVDGIDDKFEMNSGAFSESPAAAGGFLSCCCRCRKKLQGLDIFMYRGDKAFCSVECRCKQILSDEREEKCWSKAEKPHESPLSPYLAPLPFGAGVAAA